jgi:hypothetical protein
LDPVPNQSEVCEATQPITPTGGSSAAAANQNSKIDTEAPHPSTLPLVTPDEKESPAPASPDAADSVAEITPIPAPTLPAEPAPVDPQASESESPHSKTQAAEADSDEEQCPEESEFEALNSGPCIPPPGFQAALPANRHMGDKAKRRRTGKVANLPEELIEWINQQLFAEVRFGYILETLELRGAPHISQQNLTTWKAGGYLDWLDEQQARHEKQDRLEAICSLVASAGGRLDEAALMLISSQLLDTLAAYDNGLLKAEINKDPQSYHKVIQTLTKLYKVKQTFKKNNKTNLVNKPSEPGSPDFVLPDAERGLTDETLKKITDAIRLY